MAGFRHKSGRKGGLKRPLTGRERVMLSLEVDFPQPFGPESDQRAWEDWQRIRDRVLREYQEMIRAGRCLPGSRPTCFWYLDYPEVADSRQPGESDAELLRRFGLLTVEEKRALGIKDEPAGKLLEFTPQETE